MRCAGGSGLNPFHFSLCIAPMARRLPSESIVRGTIDNTRKGLVEVKLWLHGLAQPLEVTLVGHPMADIAGCKVEFRPFPGADQKPYEGELPLKQRGSCGEITASRKCRILDVEESEMPVFFGDEIGLPSHLENTLYIEWFTPELGRLLLESGGMEITVSEPAWVPTEEDARQAQEGAEAAMQDLVDRLSGNKVEPPEAREMDEFEWERFLQEGDRRTDALMELLEKFGDDENAWSKAGKFMGWDHGEDDGEDPDEHGLVLEDPEGWKAADGVDDDGDAWKVESEEFDDDDEIDEEDEEDEASLAEYVRQRNEISTRVSKLLDMRPTYKGRGDGEEFGPEQEFDFALMKLSAKLAGALDGITRDPDALPEAGMVIALLKRTLMIVDEVIALFEAAAVREDQRLEVFGIREQILQKIDGLRRGEW